MKSSTLDPEAAAVLRLLRKHPVALERLPLAEARAAMATLTRFQEQAVTLEAVRDVTIRGGRDGASVAARVYRPEGASSVAVVYVHGGGWVVGDLAMTDAQCRRLAARSGATVISLDYRLAPEHPFPAAVFDVDAALRWLGAEAGALGIDPGRLVMMGESAGANLVAAASLLARDRAEAPRVDYQILVYPATDGFANSPSYDRYATGSFLTADTMRWFWAQYLGETDPGEPLASVAHAGDLRGLPAALVVTAEFDPLRDDGFVYADRLAAAGVAVEHWHRPDLFHGFLAFAGCVGAARDVANCIAKRIAERYGTLVDVRGLTGGANGNITKQVLG